MPRIRCIKPEFPQSETIGKLSRDARLLFIQLWTIADDDGRARAASRMLASLLYPYDDDAPKLIDGWLGELEFSGCIRRYVVEDATYLEIINWLKHQKIDHPSKSRIPEFREGSRGLAKVSESLAPDLGPRILDLGSGSRTKEEDQRASALAYSFEDFWRKFPNKIGKRDAQKAFERLRKSGEISFGELMAGLERYANKTDERPWCNPATWLNQGRWQDEPGTQKRASNGHHRKVSGTELAYELAAEVREREHSAGIRRTDDPVGSH